MRGSSQSATSSAASADGADPLAGLTGAERDAKMKGKQPGSVVSCLTCFVDGKKTKSD
jgi:hypothetical protein